MSKPATVAAPPVGFRTVQRMRSVVVLPAPLGPSRPKIAPGRASKETWSTAWTSPRLGSWKVLVRSATRIMRSRISNDDRQRPGASHVGGRWHGGRLSVNQLVEDVALPRHVAGLPNGAL